MITVNSYHRDPDYTLAWFDSLIIGIWRVSPEVGQFRKVSALQQEMLGRNSVVSSLTVLRFTRFSSMPSDELRATASSIVKESQGRVRAMAMVIEAGGVVGSISRTVFTGLYLIDRRPAEHIKVFRRADEAARWVCHVPGQSAAMLESSRVLEGAVADL